MTDAQLYLAIGIPIVINVLGFTLVGMMLMWLKGDLRDFVTKVETKLDIITSKIIELDNRVTKIEVKLGIE